MVSVWISFLFVSISSISYASTFAAFFSIICSGFVSWVLIDCRNYFYYFVFLSFLFLIFVFDSYNLFLLSVSSISYICVFMICSHFLIVFFDYLLACLSMDICPLFTLSIVLSLSRQLIIQKASVLKDAEHYLII